MIEGATDSGRRMSTLTEELFPQNRSIVGEGIKKGYRQLCRNFETQPVFHHFKTGTKIGDWAVPQGWQLNSFQVKCVNSGKIVVSPEDTNLRVWSHSLSFNGEISKSEFLKHVKCHGELNDAIPYVTAYYSDTWGFSLSQREINEMCEGPFQVEINAELQDDVLEIMEIFIPGKTSEEVFFSTYLCHPSMVVNELSGPVVASELISAIEKSKNYYSYRFVFLPETIGSICYSHRYLRGSNRRVIHAFNLNCLGGFRDWAFMGSRDGNTYTDFLLRKYLADSSPGFIEYPFSERGSDERQYCNPNINLPIVSIMRKKYHEYFHIFVTVNSEPFLNSILREKRLGGQNHTELNIGRQLCDFLIYSDGRTLAEVCNSAELDLMEGVKLLEFAINNSLVKIKRRKIPKIRTLQI